MEVAERRNDNVICRPCLHIAVHPLGVSYHRFFHTFCRGGIIQEDIEIVIPVIPCGLVIIIERTIQCVGDRGIRWKILEDTADIVHAILYET